MTTVELQEELTGSQFVDDVVAGNIPSAADCAAATDEELQAALYAPLLQPSYDVGVMCATQNAIQAERRRRDVERMPGDLEAIADDPQCSAEHRETAAAALNDLESGGDPDEWAAHAWWFRHSVRGFARSTHSGTSRRRIIPAKTSTRTRARGAGRPAARRSTRSSARSGDSGADGPGEPPPPAAHCEDCGRELEDPSQDCPFCEADWRSRRGCCASCGARIVGRYRSAATCGALECERYWQALKKRRQRARLQAPLPATRTSHASVSELFGLAEEFSAKAEILRLMRQDEFSQPPPRQKQARPWRGERGEVICLEAVA